MRRRQRRAGWAGRAPRRRQYCRSTAAAAANSKRFPFHESAALAFRQIAAALAALKKKKLYESQLEQIENNILRVGEQQTMLENQRATVLTVGALQEAAQVRRAVSAALGAQGSRSGCWSDGGRGGTCAVGMRRGQGRRASPAGTGSGACSQP